MGDPPLRTHAPSGVRARNPDPQPATREEIGDRRGDIYRWVFDHNVTVVDAAVSLGYDEIVGRLLRHASPAQRLLAACARADRAAAEAVVASHPNVVASLTRDQMRLIADKAHANDTAAVALMLDLGFDARVTGPDNADALRWAAFQGNADMTRLLLRHDPPVGVRESNYGGTPLDWCVYGSVQGWAKDRGDFAITAQLLLTRANVPIQPICRADAMKWTSSCACTSLRRGHHDSHSSFSLTALAAAATTRPI